MILTVNCGSSSTRLDLFTDDARTRVAGKHASGAAVRDLLPGMIEAAAGGVTAVAHRVVHGGARFSAPVRIDGEVERELASLVRLAPLHNAPALEALREVRAGLGDGIAHVAVFDTAFFAALPEAARTYALPRELARRHGLRRFGFHGLAHQAMWRAWSGAGGRGRAVTLQLGSGASLAAIRDGQPVDTTMGFTPLEGLVMATRAGDLDPGLVTHLQRATGLDVDGLERLLYRECGLAGLAGETVMSRLVARDDASARLAVDVYCHRARRHVGAALAVLGGTDAVLFGGGVGEHVPEIRARILEGMAWAGIRVDTGRNAAPGTDGRIAASDSKVDVRVIAVDEAAELAAAAARVLSP